MESPTASFGPTANPICDAGHRSTKFFGGYYWWASVTGSTDWHKSKFMNLDGEMRERAEPGQLGSIVSGITRLCGNHRNDRAQMARPQAPEMEIGKLVAFVLNRMA